MIFSLAIHAAPYTSQASHTAYQFAAAVLNQGHQIHRIFFYRDGVNNANQLATPPQDEFDLQTAWQDLANEHKLDVVICIAAALKHGVLDAREAHRYGKTAYNAIESFTLSGLGQLIEAAAVSDRLISFGH